ncbi:MAG: hypothetical protein V1875_08970 [Candidatus Altiarchaeota archaeon]
MDYKLVSAALGILCIALAAYVLSGAGVNTVYVNNTVYPRENLSVSYIYPSRCVDCDLNKPGECDYCTSYYDDRMMDILSQDVGAPVRFYVSEVVEKPNVIVEYRQRMTLGDGRSKYNIAHQLCDVAGLAASCSLFDGEMQRIRACVSRYGVGVNTVVYHRSSKDCTLCTKMDAVVDELKNANFDENTKYKVFVVDESSPEEKKLLSECMQGFDNSDYAPQLLCPANGEDLTGEFTLGKATAFADRCMEAKI